MYVVWLFWDASHRKMARLFLFKLDVITLKSWLPLRLNPFFTHQELLRWVSYPEFQNHKNLFFNFQKKFRPIVLRWILIFPSFNDPTSFKLSKWSPFLILIHFPAQKFKYSPKPSSKCRNKIIYAHKTPQTVTISFTQWSQN